MINYYIKQIHNNEIGKRRSLYIYYKLWTYRAINIENLSNPNQLIFIKMP